jgi:DNA-binding NarL/FixJ family response regulator
MASAAWLSGRRPVGLRSLMRCGTRYALVLTMYNDDVTVLAALRAGAYGYTLKEPDRTRSSPPYG